MSEKNKRYMQEAINEAKKALALNEVPIGAIVVYKDQIISRAHNTRETQQIATHHAEVKAIEEACRYLKTWRLEGCTLYVTLEPCIMCAGAMILSRMDHVVFGAFDPKSGAVASVEQLLDVKKYNHQVTYDGGILENECSLLLKTFFQTLRKNKSLDKK